MRKLNAMIEVALAFLLAVPVMNGFIVMAPSKAKWTFMIYLDADNNLDPYGPLNLQQISEGLAADAKVSVVVLMDRFNMPAYIYRVSHGNIEMVESAGEVDMGSAQTLTWFVTYAMENYAAEYYLLDMWDHGGGYFGVCWDESSGNHLTPHDVELALAQVKRRINIVGFDACLMGMIEVCYELKDVTDIVIGSEMLIPGYGWPYKSLMQYLSANSNVDPYTLSREIVTQYVSYYENMQSTYFVQMSAINEAFVNEMATSLSATANHLSENIGTYKEAISSARSASQQKFIMGTMGVYFFIDLYKFASIINNKSSDEITKNLTADLMSEIDIIIFAEDHTKPQGNLDEKQYGLTVNFPPNAQVYSTRYETDVPCFINETTWLKLLTAYYNNC